MDQALRNKLRAAVTQCRRLLEEAVAQVLQGQFGVYATGRKDEVQVEDAARMGHLSEEDRGYRDQILVHLDHIQATGFKLQEKPTAPALQQLVREVAFTHLNRLCAYKMMETRGLIRESVGRVLKSQGFLFYLADHEDDERFHQSGQQDVAYRHFLRWLGGTLSEEVGVLFSPHDPANRLFPPQRVLEEVLALINGEDLKGIWGEDEAIGWVYQYFTPKELRDQARKESAAPRNSYELAFRNQFFTPRYVVEFLTDNTLGRIWYEMHKGDTTLRDRCRYLVRRPCEVFLKQGEPPPADTPVKDDLPQDELLKQPVYVPHRPKKDPREIKVLDPACGSGHFLLYCFDLLLVIYEEAYADPDLGPALKKDYPTLEALRKALPGLILSHNLHGIDIDRRATQIAALALWLRALRAWLEMGVKKDRPKIKRTNIVCAEPMPGENDLLEEFLGSLQPKLLAQLVRVVFEKMKLAGEAGSLLKVEKDIRTTVETAKKLWIAEREQATDRRGRTLLFSRAEMERVAGHEPQVDLFDVMEITDEQFWQEAENKVADALRGYAHQATNGKGFLRQLFADDAERGFAFVDVCSRQFDVVLMNPPFGAGSLAAKKAIDASYPSTKNDLYAAFVERGVQLLDDRGLLGAITSRTGFFLKTFQKWRQEVILGTASPVVFADLGAGVLDSAMVETSAYCLQKGRSVTQSLFIRALHTEDKARLLAKQVATPGTSAFCCDTRRFQLIPNGPFAYWTPESVYRIFRTMRTFADHGYEALTGASTKHNARFIRLKWEVNAEAIGVSAEQTRHGRGWVLTTRGGRFSRYYGDLDSVINWFDDGQQPKTFISEYYESRGWGYRWNAALNGHHRYFQAGLTWPLRGETISVRLVLRGVIPGFAGKMAYAPEKDLLWLLAITNSCVFDTLVRLFAGKVSGVQYEAGLIQQIPLPAVTEEDRARLGGLALRAWSLRRTLDTSAETSQVFTRPALLQVEGVSLNERLAGWLKCVRSSESQMEEIQADVDQHCFRLYGINESDQVSMTESFSATGDDSDIDTESDGECEPDETEGAALDGTSLTAELVSWAAGVSFGRFDVRLATPTRASPADSDPFIEHPACSPSMISQEDRLSILKAPNSYPIRIDGDGIIVDDSDHASDIVRRVREVLELVWKDRADAIEREACEILGVKELRDYFRKPGSGGFWDDHVKRYSKSRRKAPIYWLLQSGKKNYALWLYYHRLDKDILFKALVNYVEPKVRLEDDRLTGLRTRRGGASGREVKTLDRQIEKQEAFLSELRDFEDKLRRAANLHLVPDLNDGVVLNIAPLWELVPWKEAKAYWDELLAGEYEWSSIGKQLREKGELK